MKFKLVFVSPNGTTRKTSEVLKNEIEKNGHVAELIDIGSASYRGNPHKIIEKLNEADIVGFGAPAYHMDMLEPMKGLIEDIAACKSNPKFKAFLYLNYGGITSGKAFLNAEKALKQASIPVIGAFKIEAPHFHHNEEFPTFEGQEFISKFYMEIERNGFSPIPRKRLLQMFSPQKKRVNLIYPLVHFIGKRRELKIDINKEKCKACGKCGRECPVGAINTEGFAKIDLTKCIHCYHCTIACRLGAVEAPVERLDDMIKVNKRVVGTENPKNQIYI